MFTKKASFKPFAAIKGSERKKTLQRIGGQLEISVEGRNDLLPKTVQSAKCILHSGAKAQVYSAESHPLWIVLRDKLVPTVYMLQIDPDLVPAVYTVPNTRQFLQNGADFMIPGIFGTLPEAKAGSVVQVRTLEGELLAVGFALVDMQSVKEDDKGKAVEIVNFVGDTLVPENEMPPRKSQEPPSEPVEPQDSQPVEEKEDDEDDLGEGETLTSEEADEAFDYALRKVLSVTHSYPMASSSFAALLNENLPYSHPELSIKKTSYKKLTKFLKSAEKQGIMTLKERQNDLIIMSAKQNEENLPPAPKSRQRAPKPSAMEVQLYYRARSLAREVIAPAAIDQYYTASDLRKMVYNYISSNDLAAGAEVKVDDSLRKALGLKQDVTLVKREQVMTDFLKNCNMFHTIRNSNDDSPVKMLKGGVPHIEIKTERRGGNKVVTKVAGLEKFLIDPKAFAGKLRVVCAGSTTVQEARTGLEVIVQGDHTAKISKELERRGIKQSWLK